MISCDFPHGEKRISAGADLHILMCISTCCNSLKTVQIHIRGNTLFLMWEFTLNCVSPHAVIHQNLCKSAQRILYAFSGAFPQVEIHNYKCIHIHICGKLNFSEFPLLGKFTFSRVYPHEVIHFSS